MTILHPHSSVSTPMSRMAFRFLVRRSNVCIEQSVAFSPIAASTIPRPALLWGVSKRHASAMAVPTESQPEKMHSDIYVWYRSCHLLPNIDPQLEGSFPSQPRSSSRLPNRCHCRRPYSIYGSNIRTTASDDSQRRRLLRLGHRK